MFLEYEKERKKNLIPDKPLELERGSKKKRSVKHIVDLGGPKDTTIVNDNEDISEGMLAIEQSMPVKSSSVTAASVKRSEKYARPCDNCGRVMLIQGRGLCGACRSVQKTAELNGKDAPSALADAKERYNSLQTKRAEKEVQTRKTIILRFNGEDEKLYDKIMEIAKENRREPSQQIFWMLEKYETEG